MSMENLYDVPVNVRIGSGFIRLKQGRDEVVMTADQLKKVLDMIDKRMSDFVAGRLK